MDGSGNVAPMFRGHGPLQMIPRRMVVLVATRRVGKKGLMNIALSIEYYENGRNSPLIGDIHESHPIVVLDDLDYMSLFKSIALVYPRIKRIRRPLGYSLMSQP